jgi:hypothetical protein
MFAITRTEMRAVAFRSIEELFEPDVYHIYILIAAGYNRPDSVLLIGVP